MSSDWAFETKQVHAGQPVDSQTGARALPKTAGTSSGTCPTACAPSQLRGWGGQPGGDGQRAQRRRERRDDPADAWNLC